jgi:Copine
MTYQVLLILTDGEIHDMPAVKDLICSAAGLPCSIIIIGVGNEAFTMMEELDGDSEPLRDS